MTLDLQIVSSLLVGLGLAFLISLGFRHLPRASVLATDLMLGVLFGLAAIASMVFGSVSLGPGLVGDMRNVLVVTSGLFAGPAGAAVATVLTALFRLFMEGNPAAGVLAIVGSGAVGALLGHVWKDRLKSLSWLHFLAAGLAITAVNAVLPFAAVVMGWMDLQQLIDLTLRVLPSMLVVYVIGVVAIGVTLRNSLSGIETEARLRASRQTIKSLLDNTSEGYWQFDRDGNTVDVNPAMCRILERNRSEVLGRPLFDYFDAVNADLFRSRFNGADRRPKGRSEFELQLPDGAAVPCLMSHTLIDDEAGRNQGAIALVSEIRERKEMEKSLRRALISARDANTSKSVFLATMSHELRTPLNAIIGFSSILREQLFGALGHPRYLDYAEDIRNSGNHLLSLINDILDISAVELGKRELDPVELDLQSLFAHCLAFVADYAQKSGVRLEQKVETDAAFLVADEKAMKQILLNLLTNAIKFSAAGDQVRLSAHRDGQMLCITVADTGMGIREDSLPKITEPFARGQEIAQTTQEGVGLGLAIVKGLVEAHTGELLIESEHQVGTNVSLRLPLYAAGQGAG